MIDADDHWCAYESPDWKKLAQAAITGYQASPEYQVLQAKVKRYEYVLGRFASSGYVTEEVSSISANALKDPQ